MHTAMNRDTSAGTERQFSWLRTAAIALALLVQLPQLIMLEPVSPWPSYASSSHSDDKPLRLSFFYARPPSTVALHSRAIPLPAGHHPWWARRQPRQAMPRRMPDRSGTVATSRPLSPAASPMPKAHTDFAPLAAIAPDSPRGYIPGGGHLDNGGSGYRRDADFVPGTDQIAHAPHFAMVAAEQQGIGRRVVNLIGSLTHATDPHCLDVAVWNGMSPVEQIAHHTSPARIADYTERYHCVPPPRY